MIEKGEILMKDTLLRMLKKAKPDAKYMTYEFLEGSEGSFRNGNITQETLLPMVEEASEVSKSDRYNDVIMVDGLGITSLDVGDNIYYHTENVEGYLEHVSKYNPYYKVYIKLDKENRTISFKLGKQERTLQLMEGTEFVSKPYYKKGLKVVSAENLEKHIQDEFWNPRMVNIGHTVLGINRFFV